MSILSAPIPPNLTAVQLDGLASVYMEVAVALRAAADKYEKTARDCLEQAKVKS